MKKLQLICAIFLLSQYFIFSQTCLPEGITFQCQADIDNFQTNYPGCSEIEGLVYIWDSTNLHNDITNVDGLSVLTRIGGSLTVRYNHTLTNLSGFSNLTSVGGNLDIGGSNWVLRSLSGLENLTSIGGNLKIVATKLTNLAPLANLTAIPGNLDIHGNDYLTSLSGLDNITSVSGYLIIGDSGLGEGNIVLTSIAALENLASVGEYIVIMRNDELLNLNGLEKLTNVPGKLSIAANSSLTSISGLSNVTSIGGWLKIYSNDALSSLSGLDNLITIGDELQIYNESLTSLDGLESLSSIGGSLSIGGQFGGNPNLADITSLSNLSLIGGYLSIRDNAILTSLSGLDNINPATINSLYIHENPLLSTCEVQSICNYLVSQDADIEIYENATGCSNEAEVIAVCEFTNASELIPEAIFTVYPNPASKEIYISNKNSVSFKEVVIYDQIGQKVLQKPAMNNRIDVSELKRGMYIIKLLSNESHYFKIIIE